MKLKIQGQRTKPNRGSERLQGALASKAYECSDRIKTSQGEIAGDDRRVAFQILARFFPI